MTVNYSPTEAIEFIGNAFTSLGLMVLLITIGAFGLVCCKKRKPKVDAHMTAGNEGHYTKRGTRIITDDMVAHNNAVTIQMTDLSAVKYDKALDLDYSKSQGEPPLNVSVSSKTRLVVVEDDSDYAVIGHDSGPAAVDNRTASVTAETTEGENFHTVEIETFDEINNEDDYSTIADELHKASKRKSVSESESNKAESKRSQVDIESINTDVNVDLQVEDKKFVDDYATIVPKSLRIKNPEKVKRILQDINDIDTPGHDVMGWPDNAIFENTRTDMPESLHTSDPNLIKQSQKHFPENTNEAAKPYHTLSNTLGQNDPMESALQKLGDLLGELPSDTDENNRSMPSGQVGHTLMDTSAPQPGLSISSNDFDESPSEPHRIFQLSL